MSITADKIIVEIEASTGKARADLAVYERLFGKSMSGIETGASRAEQQFRASAAGISSGLKGLAASFAAAFSAQKVATLADSYTKFTNQLKVAGLEGTRLGKTQEDLFGIAQKYGSELESIGTLYSRLAGNTKDLGLSNADLLKFVEGTSAALKVSGQSAGEASGALLQLSQALGGSKIQAEEYNSLIDGARPLLQAVASGSDRFAGSVSKLTTAVKAGTVSTQEFVQAGLKGIPQLISQAEKSSLTIGASFTILNNALGKYVGQTDQALSATARISQAISLLAANLDTVIPALATIATFLAVRYVAGAVAATAATIAKSAADVRATQTAIALAAAEAELSGLMLGNAAAANVAAGAVTRLSVAQGVAARGFSALGALLGGPVGIAITALGAGFYALTQYTKGADQATGAFAKAEAESGRVTNAAATAADKLATAHGKARVEALALARAEAENVKQKLASARASLFLAQAELTRAKSFQAAQNSAAASAGGSVPMATSGIMRMTGERKVNSAQTNLNSAQKTVSDLEKSLKTINDALAAPAPRVSPVAAGKITKGNHGKSGKTAAEIATEHAEEMAKLSQEEIQAQLAITTDADARAALSYDLLAQEFKEREDKIKLSKDFTAKQKAAQLAELKKLYGVGGLDANGDIVVDAKGGLLGQAIERDHADQLQQERTELLQANYDIEREELESARDAAATQAERREIGQALVDLEFELKRSLLEQIKHSQTASAAMKDRAQAALDNLPGARQRAGAANIRDTEGPLDQYLRRNDPSKNGERAEQLVVNELDHVQQGITSALTKAIGTDDPLITGLINMLLQEVIFRPLAEALKGGAGGLGGGGGLFGGLFSGIGHIFGFAGGGSMTIGGRGGNDNNTLSLNGRPIANVQRGETLSVGSKALSGRGGGQTIISSPRFDLRGAVVTSQLYADMERISRANANQASAAMGQAVIKAVPNRMAQFNRDGT